MFLEKLQELQESGSDREKLENIADSMEEHLGKSQMWDALRPGFSYDELLENLIYIAREEDI